MRQATKSSLFAELLDAGLGALALAIVLWLAGRIARRLAHGNWGYVEPPTQSAPRYVGVPGPPKGRIRIAAEMLGRWLMHRLGDLVVLVVGFAGFEGLRFGGAMIRAEYPFELWARRLSDGMWGAAATVVVATGLALHRRGRARRTKASDDTWAYYFAMLGFLIWLPGVLCGLGGLLYFWNHMPETPLGRAGVSGLAYAVLVAVCCGLIKAAAAVDR